MPENQRRLHRTGYGLFMVACLLAEVQSFATTDPKLCRSLLAGVDTTAASHATAMVASANPSRSSILSNLPPDIRERMVVAETQTLGIGDSDTMRGQMLTDWSPRAIAHLKMIGVSENELSAKVTARLEAFLQDGRAQGLSAELDRVQLLGPDISANPASASLLKKIEGVLFARTKFGNFQSKYNLSAYSVIRNRLGRFDAWKTGHLYYSTSLQTAFDMAYEIGDRGRASEVVLHMIRLGNLDAACNTAEKLKDDQALINIGMLAMVDFYEGRGRSRYRGNDLWTAVEAFKRVQGPMKARAEEILFDLAAEVASPEFLEKVVAAEGIEPSQSREQALNDAYNTYERYSIRALRSTGELVARRPIDSMKVNFITTVDNSVVRQEIQRRVDRAMAMNSNPDLEEIKDALSAIGDKDRLNQYAASLLNQRQEHPHRFYRFAFDFYEAAGNFEQAKRVLSLMRTGGLTDLNCMDYELFLPRDMAAIGDTEGLREIAQDVETRLASLAPNDPGRRGWENAKNKIQRAIAGLPLEEPGENERAIPDDGTLSPGLRRQLLDENYYRMSQAKYRAELTSQKRARLISEGNSLMRNRDYWNAFHKFNEALYRQGLLDVADAMIRGNNGLQAKSPLLAAALLLPSDNNGLPPPSNPQIGH